MIYRVAQSQKNITNSPFIEAQSLRRNLEGTSPHSHQTGGARLCEPQHLGMTAHAHRRIEREEILNAAAAHRAVLRWECQDAPTSSNLRLCRRQSDITNSRLVATRNNELGYRR